MVPLGHSPALSEKTKNPKDDMRTRKTMCQEQKEKSNVAEFEMPVPLKNDPLPKELQIDLLRTLSRGTGRGFTQEEAEKVFEWGEKSLIGASLLDLATKGLLKISFGAQGELLFDAVRPNPQDKGTRHVALRPE
jgi:hypothetical protein